MSTPYIEETGKALSITGVLFLRTYFDFDKFSILYSQSKKGKKKKKKGNGGGKKIIKECMYITSHGDITLDQQPCSTVFSHLIL